MKKILFFLIVVLGVHCSQKDGTVTSKTETESTLEQLPILITGKRTNDSKIKNYLLTSKFGNEQVKLDSNHFHIKLTNNQPMILSLAIDFNTRFPLFVLPGDSLHLEFREKDVFNGFNKISFSGKHQLENKLFYDLNNIFKYDIPNHHYFYNFSEPAFLRQIDSLEQVGKTFIQKVEKENPDVHPFFVEAMQQFVQSSIALYLENYPKILRQNFRKDLITKSNAYLKKEAALFEEDSDLMNNFAYLRLIKEKNWNAAYAVFQKNKLTSNGSWNPNLKTQFSVADSIFQNKDLQDFLKFEMLRGEMLGVGKDMEIFLEKYRSGNPAPHYLKVLEKEYADFVGKFSKEVVLSDYKFEDITGRACSLEELKGLVIYIDVWATWCGPCHRERKYFEKLIELYKEEEDLVFVGISVDTPEEKTTWKNMVQDKHIGGIQLFANDGFQSKFAKDFNIFAIPRFLIIGRDGEIVYANALKPSAENIHEVLDEVLQNDDEINMD